MTLCLAFFFLFNVVGGLPECVSVPCVSNIWGSQKKVLDPWDYSYRLLLVTTLGAQN